MVNQLKIQSKDDGPKIYNWYQMLENVIHIFTIVKTAIIIFFGIIVLFALWIIIKKQIEKEKNKIGILKSLGYNQVQIALAYSFYPLIPIIVGVIFGWVIRLVLQIPIIGVLVIFLPCQTSLMLIIHHYFIV